ncbi:hypothetical protein M434DRAFT_402200 [Hypoxylon sp. CO27-5]|nr:hypothetical protein M434DRAFT_402200 [Hypoxylon sp. CO27-5]
MTITKVWGRLYFSCLICVLLLFFLGGKTTKCEGEMRGEASSSASFLDAANLMSKVKGKIRYGDRIYQGALGAKTEGQKNVLDSSGAFGRGAKERGLLSHRIVHTS